jgi:hypothetical protein
MHNLSSDGKDKVLELFVLEVKEVSAMMPVI